MTTEYNTGTGLVDDLDKNNTIQPLFFYGEEHERDIDLDGAFNKGGETLGFGVLHVTNMDVGMNGHFTAYTDTGWYFELSHELVKSIVTEYNARFTGI